MCVCVFSGGYVVRTHNKHKEYTCSSTRISRMNRHYDETGEKKSKYTNNCFALFLQIPYKIYTLHLVRMQYIFLVWISCAFIHVVNIIAISACNCWFCSCFRWMVFWKIGFVSWWCRGDATSINCTIWYDFLWHVLSPETTWNTFTICAFVDKIFFCCVCVCSLLLSILCR